MDHTLLDIGKAVLKVQPPFLEVRENHCRRSSSSLGQPGTTAMEQSGPLQLEAKWLQLVLVDLVRGSR